MITPSIVIAILLLLCLANGVPAQTVTLIPKEREKRVDIEVDGKVFTSYRWDERIKRPVLYPIMSAAGSFITRGFPFETRDGETVDHPHQVGSSLSYGDVNGVDFWNTSTFRSSEELKKMGTIAHRKILSVRSGKGRGDLAASAAWVLPDGKMILVETTRFAFHAEGSKRWIDRETILTASGDDVVFGDSKEGVFAIHVAGELEQTDQISVKVTSTDGVISERKKDAELTGRYFSSERLVGNNVWGTVGKWAAVSGRLKTGDVTVAVFDSPKNHNFPSYMMVRGYGLLALNPFGQKLFDAKKAERKFTLRFKESLVLRYRMLILPEIAAAEQVEKEYQRYVR